MPHFLIGRLPVLSSTEARKPGAVLIFEEGAEIIYEDDSPMEGEENPYERIEGLLTETAEIPFPELEEDEAMQDQWHNAAQYQIQQVDDAEGNVTGQVARKAVSSWDDQQRSEEEISRRDSNDDRVNGDTGRGVTATAPNERPDDSRGSDSRGLPPPKAAVIPENSLSASHSHNRRNSPTHERRAVKEKNDHHKRSRTDEKRGICKFFNSPEG